MPTMPNWFLPYLPYWFGGEIYDEQTDTLQLTSPRVLAAYQWLYDYSAQIGARKVRRFHASMGSRNWNSPENPFLSGRQAMLLQGVWMANFIEKLRPSWNRWRISDQTDPDARDAEIREWKAQELTLPLADRRAHYRWGAAPFPSAMGTGEITFAGFDVLVIPAGAKHKKEALEFMLFVNRQDIMERLCASHCKNSPLAQVSDTFLAEHPNPYVHVFERMTAGPAARSYPKFPLWPSLEMDLLIASVEIGMLRREPAEILAELQQRYEARYESFKGRQRARRGQ
jgi:ABC-type glycerol-3-phosphate transport system substrate-binding protein